ncbi:MAG: D-alanyl-D-alanine carboxypeptidase [Betaproteobacteria bacterium]|nr:D-alanyl-D-alanine carboxypeptidase [Betaproteobacteria bacterium]
MRLFFSLLILLFAQAAQAQSLPQPPSVLARSWLLFDAASGQVLAAQAADERVEPASLTKLMTAYLSFSALQRKSIAMDQTVPVSERAWKASGSRMFIDPKHPVAVGDLLRGMIVQSGNDASVALAEVVGGSEENFAQMMNREAQRLGLRNTHFTNATGLPDPQHYSTARDLVTLAAAMIRDFPDLYAIHSDKEFTYNKIRQPNRNRLLWLDPTVDGIKTGHTETAGYCLIGSAKRGSRRLVAAVMGTSSDTVRVHETQRLLNFGFQAYETVKLYGKDQAVSELRVWKGAGNTVKAGFPEDLVLSVPQGQGQQLKASMVSQQPLLAPVARGQQVGTLKLTLNGQPFGEYPVQAIDGVSVAGFFGRLWDSLRLWLQ